MDASLDNFKKKFIEEAVDLIDDLEKTVLELEDNTTDADIVQRIFRIMHTLKGNSSMFGFEQIDRFTHHMETIYDQVRSGEREVTQATLNVTLRSVDHLKNLLDEAGNERAALMKEQEALMQQMDAIIEGRPVPADAPQAPAEETQSVPEASVKAAPQPIPTEEKGAYETFFIHYAPVTDIFNNGTNPLYQVDELQALGKAKIKVHFEKVPPLAEIEPSFCYTSWEIILATDKGQNAIDDVFIFVEGDSDLKIERLESGNLLENTTFVSELENLWAKQTEANLDEIRKIIPSRVVVQQTEVAATTQPAARMRQRTLQYLLSV